MSQTTFPSNDLIATHLDAARNELTGQVTVMDRNDRIRHDKFCAGMIECLKPGNALETQLAQSIAEDYWRLNRMRGLEEGIFSQCHPDPSGPIGEISMEHDISISQTRAFLWKQADFRFLSQYEMRIQRALNRNKEELKQLQAERGRKPEDGFVLSMQPTAPEPPASLPPTSEAPKTRAATAAAQTPAPDSPAPPQAAETGDFAFSSRPAALETGGAREPATP